MKVWFVLILPMRNGNKSSPSNTREASSNQVLILPMRNGNLLLLFQSFFSSLSGSYPTYEEWKHDYVLYGNAMWYVLILPMRNGNSEAIVRTVLEALAVLILPMRNGNLN